MEEHDAARLLRVLADWIEYGGAPFTTWYLRYLRALTDDERRRHADLAPPAWWAATIAACPPDVRRSLYAYRAKEEGRT